MIVLCIFAGIAALNILYFFLLSNFKEGSQPCNKLASLPISVVIAAKNESQNLAAYLPKILEQHYQNFEVIVVNDASSDTTLKVLQDLQKSYPILKIVSLDRSQGKKQALTAGISNASHEHLLFTDADCMPNSNLWIAAMARHFTPKKKLLLGFGGYSYISGFLNKLIRYETIITAMQYFGMAHWGSPYMGVGRNLGYTKTLFQKAEGFISHSHLLSGDDDLFISQMANSSNTAIVVTPNSFTRSIPKQHFKEWIAQKRRHITTAHHYHWYHQLLLSCFFIFSMTFWILFTYLVLYSEMPMITLFVALSRLTLQGIVINKLTRVFVERGILWFYPLLEISLLGVQASLFIANIVTKPKRWH